MSSQRHNTKISPRNKDLLAHLSSQINAQNEMLFVNYRGLSVNDTETMRAALKEKGATMTVVKNRIAKRAIENLDIDQNCIQILRGPTAIIHGGSDNLELLKTLVNFHKIHQALMLKGAVIGSVFYDESNTLAIAALPPRAHLIRQIMFTLKGPIQNIVQVLHRLVSNPVVVLNEITKIKK